MMFYVPRLFGTFLFAGIIWLKVLNVFAADRSAPANVSELFTQIANDRNRANAPLNDILYVFGAHDAPLHSPSLQPHILRNLLPTGVGSPIFHVGGFHMPNINEIRGSFLPFRALGDYRHVLVQSYSRTSKAGQSSLDPEVTDSKKRRVAVWDVQEPQQMTTKLLLPWLSLLDTISTVKIAVLDGNPAQISDLLLLIAAAVGSPKTDVKVELYLAVTAQNSLALQLLPHISDLKEIFGDKLDIYVRDALNVSNAPFRKVTDVVKSAYANALLSNRLRYVLTGLHSEGTSEFIEFTPETNRDQMRIFQQAKSFQNNKLLSSLFRFNAVGNEFYQVLLVDAFPGEYGLADLLHAFEYSIFDDHGRVVTPIQNIEGFSTEIVLAKGDNIRDVNDLRSVRFTIPLKGFSRYAQLQIRLPSGESYNLPLIGFRLYQNSVWMLKHELDPKKVTSEVDAHLAFVHSVWDILRSKLAEYHAVSGVPMDLHQLLAITLSYTPVNSRSPSIHWPKSWGRIRLNSREELSSHLNTAKARAKERVAYRVVTYGNNLIRNLNHANPVCP